jgi:hypothetical protein
VSEFRFIQPCSPIRAKEVPAGDGWLHEVKFDGYRVQVHKIGSRVVLYSRNGHDFTERFPSVAQLLQELPAKVAVLDGEVVASDADGRPKGECKRVNVVAIPLLALATAQRTDVECGGEHTRIGDAVLRWEFPATLAAQGSRAKAKLLWASSVPMDLRSTHQAQRTPGLGAGWSIPCREGHQAAC